MWRFILVAAFPFIFGGVIKPLDETIWKNRLAEVILTEDNTSHDKSSMFRNQFSMEDDVEGN